MYHISYILLGSNLGDKEFYLSQARDLIRAKSGIILAASSIYETEPWGDIRHKIQDNYLNQVLKIETTLDPEDLLEAFMNIEKELGRKRIELSIRSECAYQPRTIDLDILFYDDIVLPEARVANARQQASNNELTIPHPLIQERRFVLVPLNEIAAEFMHPVLKKSVKQLLEEITDTLEVKVRA